MMREDNGWSVFYRDIRYDLVLLYRGCRLEEAAAVCEEHHGTGQISDASMPEHYRSGDKAVSPAVVSLVRRQPDRRGRTARAAA